MSILMKQALQSTHRGLTRVSSKIERLLKGQSVTSRRKPFVTGLAQAYARSWLDCPCVFVLSTGRVGTKTLTALLALSPHVVATHEPEPRLVKASFDAYMESNSGASEEKWRAVILAARDDAVCEANRRGKIYVETNNRLTYLAHALAVSFPASRFIHLHRHPYEVVRSAMRRGYYQAHNWDFARIRPRPGEDLAAEWEALSPLEKSAWYWARVNGEAREFLSTLPAARRLDLQADALFAGDETVLKNLFNFVSIDLPARTQLEEVLGQKINAQRKGEFPTPSEWSEAERVVVRDRVRVVASALGYDI